MIFYLAADFARKGEMQGVRHILETLGHKVISTWHENDQEQSFGIGGREINDSTLEAAGGYGISDSYDLLECEVLLFFTTGQPSRGGRHTEFGMARARGRRVIIVGPRENVFQCAPDIEQHDNWSRFVMWLSRGYLD